jgi:hypothetical protein
MIYLGLLTTTGQKIGKNIGKNRQKESANTNFTDAANVGTNLMPDTIISQSLVV